MHLRTNITGDLTDELALIKIKRAKKCFLGFKQSLKSNATEVFMSADYAKKEAAKISDYTNTNFYILSKSFFERFCVEKKRYHPVNVIGILQ